MPIYRAPKRGVSYSEALTEAYASAPEDEVLLDTLEFRHASFVTAGLPYAVRIVNDHDALLATLEADAPVDAGLEVSFTPCYFDFVRPQESETGATAEVEISINNVARILVPYLDAVKEDRSPIEITWRPYLASDLSGPHILPPLTLYMRSAHVDMSRVTARAGFGNLVNRRFPAIEYNSQTHPGLAAR
jgi:hypothetical protein